MELDEALVKITELQEEIKSKDTVINTLTSERNNLDKENKRLQESNLKLFLKITNDNEDEEKIDQLNNEEKQSFNDFLKDWDL